ncbi:MAG: sugar transferase [Treponemataceae bacterium]
MEKDFTSIDGIEINKKNHRTYLFFKRAFDFSAAFCAFYFFLPVFILLAICIKLDSKGKVVFSQNRIGRNGKVFKIYKFRTMVYNADEVFNNFNPVQKAEFAKKFKLENDPRITRIGDFLRKTSLDELPQLWNVIKGDMSLVGHRPIVKAEIERYGKYFNAIFERRPGLTGYWQANGRSETTYEKRVAMDLYYAINKCFSLDIDILFKTVTYVIKRKGAM